MRQTPYFWNMEKILSYNDLPRCTEFVNYCQQFNRPILCSEWMARSRGSDYFSILPLFKKNKIGSFSYGLVNGKQQCHYPWNPVVDGKPVPFEEEPAVWFHDLFYPDHTPYSENEIRFIKEMTRCLSTRISPSQAQGI